ncbi:hypothetical protein [Desulfosarcina cetonica]
MIAERILTQLYTGTGSVISWLGPKENQSLFRREQLRQLLEMLSEETPSDFSEHARALLESGEVRFHLQHLVLEVIGQLKDIDASIGRYCHELIADSYWQEYIVETVIWGHASWVLYMLEQGIIANWLSGMEEQKTNRALWLLRSVAESIPDQVTDVLQPYLNEGGKWPQRILNTICWKAVDDSEQMFEIRLQLARMGQVSDFIAWKPYCEKYPLRAIRLIEAVISTWRIDDEQNASGQKDRLEKWYDEDIQALYSAVEQFPGQTWDMLVDHIERLTGISNELFDPRLERWNDPLLDEKSEDIARGVVKLVISAGQAMAANQPDDLIKRVGLLENSISPIIQKIIISAYAHLPATHADVGITWLLGNPLRFRLGSGYREPGWMPAVRLIKALSPYCSEEVFDTLEETIIHYHASDELVRSSVDDLLDQNWIQILKKSAIVPGYGSSEAITFLWTVRWGKVFRLVPIES